MAHAKVRFGRDGRPLPNKLYFLRQYLHSRSKTLNQSKLVWGGMILINPYSAKPLNRRRLRGERTSSSISSSRTPEVPSIVQMPSYDWTTGGDTNLSHE